MLSTAFAKTYRLTAISIVVASGVLSGCAGYVEKSVSADKDLPVAEFISRKFTGPSNAPAPGTELVRFNEVDMSQFYRPKRYLTIYCGAQGGELVLAKESRLNPFKPLQVKYNPYNPEEEQRRDRSKLETAYEKIRAEGVVGQLACRDTGTKNVRWKVSIEPTNDFRQENQSNFLESNHVTLKIRELK